MSDSTQVIVHMVNGEKHTVLGTVNKWFEDLKGDGKAGVVKVRVSASSDEFVVINCNHVTAVTQARTGSHSF